MPDSSENAEPWAQHSMRVAVDEALGERDVAVRADVADRVHLVVGVADDGDRRRRPTSTRIGGVLLELAQRADTGCGHSAAPS